MLIVFIFLFFCHHGASFFNNSVNQGKLGSPLEGNGMNFLVYMFFLFLFFSKIICLENNAPIQLIAHTSKGRP